MGTLNGQKVFVTGANGRIGLPLIRRLVAEGATVVGLARSTDGVAAVEAAGAAAVHGDLGDTATLRAGADGASIIFHLAGGLRGAGQVTADVVNHQGTRALISATQAADRSKLRAFVFTSTCAVYGDRSGMWLDELMPPMPQTHYGASKVKAESAVAEAHRAWGLPTRVARVAAVYGPGFPFMLAERIQAGQGWLPGEGRNYVPTVHIDDVVGALLRIAESGTNGEVYNVADQAPVSLRVFYDQVHQHVGGKPVRFWSTWVPSYVQYGLARFNERLTSRVGGRPQVTPDALRLFTASSRMKTTRLEQDLGYEWRWPSSEEGLAATFSG